MHLSHSGLQQILTCPASYFLYKKEGISPKTESKALQIGSAFHWGCEHNTEDLTEYLKEIDLYQWDKYDFKKDVIMAEGMLHGYFKHKDELYSKILLTADGETLEILDEQHELDLVVPLKSYKYDTDHEFHGIIDLLLLTEKGWIILDYKTSSQRPDWDKYLDQVIRYCWMLKSTFPDIPVYKVGIINVRKTGIKLKTNENYDNFLMRVKREYDINDDELIEYHEFYKDVFTDEKMKLYVDNLSRMSDFAQTIEDNNLWFINYGNATSVYGKSEYWDFFYKTKDYGELYKIADEMYNDNYGEVTAYRDCTQLDLDALEESLKGKLTLNHYKDFKREISDFEVTDYHDFKSAANKFLKEKYLTDDNLLEKYWSEYWRELSEQRNSDDSESNRLG